jgi:hypothetical protein
VSGGGGVTVLVIAKAPRPGRVKTRLTPVYAPGEAAQLAEAALADTLAVVRDLPARRRVLVLDGAPGDWLPPGFDVVPQVPGGLDERLAAAFGGCTGPALLVGMDTPQLAAGLLAPALADDAWSACDAYLGPALDGGFWALGLARPDPELLRGVPMSTPHTGAAQHRRLLDAGLRVRELPPLRDVDTPADVPLVAEAAPRTRFAATAHRLAAADRADRDRAALSHATPTAIAADRTTPPAMAPDRATPTATAPNPPTPGPTPPKDRSTPAAIAPDRTTPGPTAPDDPSTLAATAPDPATPTATAPDHTTPAATPPEPATPGPTTPDDRSTPAATAPNPATPTATAPDPATPDSAGHHAAALDRAAG